MMASTTARLRVEKVSHVFAMSGSKAPRQVLNNVEFDVSVGELTCLIGPSGCGKSTLLKMLAGFIFPSEGKAYIDGHPITGPSSDRILIFQDLHLFDWMSVLRNVEFALEAKGIPKLVRHQQAKGFLKTVGLTDFDHYYPSELSGGMKHRLALARAFAADPEVLLMDEPFAALDLESRLRLETELLVLSHSKKLTTILVTHDVRQAIFLADRILVMSECPGTIKQSITVPFPTPRTNSIRHTKEFHALEDSLSENLGIEKNG